AAFESFCWPSCGLPTPNATPHRHTSKVETASFLMVLTTKDFRESISWIVKRSCRVVLTGRNSAGATMVSPKEEQPIVSRRLRVIRKTKIFDPADGSGALKNAGEVTDCTLAERDGR